MRSASALDLGGRKKDGVGGKWRRVRARICYREKKEDKSIQNCFVFIAMSVVAFGICMSFFLMSAMLVSRGNGAK